MAWQANPKKARVGDNAGDPVLVGGGLVDRGGEGPRGP